MLGAAENHSSGGGLEACDADTKEPTRPDTVSKTDHSLSKEPGANRQPEHTVPISKDSMKGKEV